MFNFFSNTAQAVKVLIISFFSISMIEITEKLTEFNGIIELIIQGLIGILTIIYLIIKIKNGSNCTKK